MEPTIDLAKLKGIGLLYEGDLHDLGQFVLKACDARWTPDRQRQNFPDAPDRS